MTRRRGIYGPGQNPRSRANLKVGGALPAPIGNKRHFTHGGYAEIAAEVLDAKAREVYDALAADAPHATPMASFPATMPWSFACSRTPTRLDGRVALRAVGDQAGARSRRA